MGNCLRVSSEHHDSLDDGSNLNLASKYGKSEDLNTEDFQDCLMEFPDGGDASHDRKLNSPEFGRDNETQTAQFTSSNNKYKTSGKQFYPNYRCGSENGYNKQLCKSSGDIYPDNETASSFAETWDPALFDHPPNHHHHHHGYHSPKYSQPIRHSEEFRYRHRNHAKYGPRRQYQDNRYNMQSWSSDESFPAYTPAPSRFPFISTSNLGFSALSSNMDETMEWYRNGELEGPHLNTNNYLIKSKQQQQPPPQQTPDMNTSTSNIIKGNNTHSKSTNHDGWLRYTMFLHQGETDDVEFVTNIRKARHTLMSLENKTGCEIRLSKRLFIHRGKVVRTVVIDGPSRKNIIRCYSSLPEILTRFMILECERPSIYDTKSDRKLPELGPFSKIPSPTVLPNTAMAA